MPKVEKWSVGVFFSASLLALTIFLGRTTELKHLDSVFLFECAESILECGRPVSATVSSWPDALKTFQQAPEELCRASMVGSPKDYNVYRNHAYTILYPIAALAALIGVEWAFAFLNAMAHLLMVLLPYLYLRRQGIGVLSSSAFALMVALYPVLTLSATGDYYLDRLYMPAALFALYGLNELASVKCEGPARRWWTVSVILAVILAALHTERAVIMMLMALGVYLCTSPVIRNDRRALIGIVGVLVALVGYLFLYFALAYEGIEGGGGIVGNALGSIKDPMSRLAAPGFYPFVVINAVFMGYLILFSGLRGIALALAAMLPNALVTVGGAELNGWSTHYHVMYIPFIVFTASLGFGRIASRMQPYRATRLGFPLTVAIVGIACVVIIDPYTGGWAPGRGGAFQASIDRKVWTYFVHPRESSEKASSGHLRRLNEFVPAGSKMSAVEGVMPALYHGRRVSYFPIDMDQADYIVVGGSAPEGMPITISGAISYLGAAQAVELNRCLLERMTANGFTLHNNVNEVGVLVFKRDGRRPERSASP